MNVEVILAQPDRYVGQTLELQGFLVSVTTFMNKHHSETWFFSSQEPTDTIDEQTMVPILKDDFFSDAFDNKDNENVQALHKLIGRSGFDRFVDFLNTITSYKGVSIPKHIIHNTLWLRYKQEGRADDFEILQDMGVIDYLIEESKLINKYQRHLRQNIYLTLPLTKYTFSKTHNFYIPLDYDFLVDEIAVKSFPCQLRCLLKWSEQSTVGLSFERIFHLQIEHEAYIQYIADQYLELSEIEMSIKKVVSVAEVLEQPDKYINQRIRLHGYEVQQKNNWDVMYIIHDTVYNKLADPTPFALIVPNAKYLIDNGLYGPMNYPPLPTSGPLPRVFSTNEVNFIGLLTYSDDSILQLTEITDAIRRMSVNTAYQARL